MHLPPPPPAYHTCRLPRHGAAAALLVALPRPDVGVARSVHNRALTVPHAVHKGAFVVRSPVGVVRQQALRNPTPFPHNQPARHSTKTQCSRDEYNKAVRPHGAQRRTPMTPTYTSTSTSTFTFPQPQHTGEHTGTQGRAITGLTTTGMSTNILHNS